MENKDKYKNFYIQAVNKMLEISNHPLTYEDLLKEQEQGEPPFYTKYTQTSEQHEEFKDWYIKECSKQLKMSKKRAEGSFAWFDLDVGLQVK